MTSFITGCVAAASVTAAQAPPNPSAHLEQAGGAAPSSPGAAKPHARDYCTALQEQIAQAHVDRQNRDLRELITAMEQKIATLEEATVTLKEWVEKRDTFVERARDSLVQMYARMPQEAAAAQMASMSEATAAAILMRMDAKRASVVLAEIEAGKAGRLSAIIAAAADPGLPARGPASETAMKRGGP